MLNLLEPLPEFFLTLVGRDPRRPRIQGIHDAFDRHDLGNPDGVSAFEESPPDAVDLVGPFVEPILHSRILFRDDHPQFPVRINSGVSTVDARLVEHEIERVGRGIHEHDAPIVAGLWNFTLQHQCLVAFQANFSHLIDLGGNVHRACIAEPLGSVPEPVRFKVLLNELIRGQYARVLQLPAKPTEKVEREQIAGRASVGAD